MKLTRREFLKCFGAAFATAALPVGKLARLPVSVERWEDIKPWLAQELGFEVGVYFPPPVTDFDMIRRCTMDWYADGKRYGAKVCWHHFDTDITPQRVAEALLKKAREVLAKGDAISVRDLWLPDGATLWLPKRWWGLPENSTTEKEQRHVF